MSWQNSVYKRRDSKGRRNSGAKQEESALKAESALAKEPQVKLLRRRQPTLGLERDDWKVPDKTAQRRVNTQEREKSRKDKVEKNKDRVKAYRRSLSSEAKEQIEKLRETDAFKQWVKSFRHEDARFPALFSFLDVGQVDKQILKERFLTWAASFRRCDPRYQILKFFNDVAQEGADNIWNIEESTRHIFPKFFNIFNRASVFTVWRPTSVNAIRLMMLGEGVGKGLDIKGKSAKKGRHSGFVPFLQIYEEKHKRQVRTLPKDGTMRIFYSTKEARDSIAENLMVVGTEMMDAVTKAKAVIADETSDVADQETAFQHLLWDMDDPNVYLIDDYAPGCFGLELPERLFWEAYVMRQDCGRHADSEYDTGRPSEPAFQDMNFAALRHPPGDLAYRPVLWQFTEEHPMCPRNLLMAYEERGRVMPVVSDFDCFLIGTRRVTYECNLPAEQLHLLKWCVDQIETILDSPTSTEGWTARWLEVLKKEALKGFNPECPRFGFGDFKSYSIMQRACGRLLQNGCVRHGAECFNYYFPQELDSEFLVISDTLPGKVPWKYMKEKELQEFLVSRIDEGYTMPLNPKWVLCDPGWKRVYDRLIASPKQNIQTSMDVWFPPNSGVREKIEAIYATHPEGFQVKCGQTENIPKRKRSSLSGTAAMDLGELELKHHVKLQRAKRKLLTAVSVMHMSKELAGTQELKSLAIRRAVSDGAHGTVQKDDPSHRIRAGLRAALFFIKLRRDLSAGTADGSEISANTFSAVAEQVCDGHATTMVSEERAHHLTKTVQPTKETENAFLFHIPRGPNAQSPNTKEEMPVNPLSATEAGPMMPLGGSSLRSSFFESIDEETNEENTEATPEEPHIRLCRQGSDGIVALKPPRVEKMNEDLTDGVIKCPSSPCKPALGRSASEGIPHLVAPESRRNFAKKASI